MTITLDTTPGGSGANSYVTLEQGDEYLEAHLVFRGVWSAMDEAEKAARLVRAAQAIDRMDFIGSPLTVDQALAFPRVRPADERPLQLDLMDLTVPNAVQRAQCEMVIHLWADSDAATGRSAGTRELATARVDGVAAVSYADAGDRAERESAAGGSLAAVRSLLRPWLRYGFEWSR